MYRQVLRGVRGGQHGQQDCYTDGEMVLLVRSLVALAATSEAEVRLVWRDLGAAILEFTVNLTSSRSKVEIIGALADLAKARKVTPEIFFSLGINQINQF